MIEGLVIFLTPFRTLEEQMVLRNQLHIRVMITMSVNLNVQRTRIARTPEPFLNTAFI